MKSDPGYFGPKSMMWKVNKEITVLFGGAQAWYFYYPLMLLVHGKLHFIKGIPGKDWLEPSFETRYFGTIEEAIKANRINKLHEVINGKDEITGNYYDALDHDQLLWVHACLQLSSIYFYEKTVRKLSDIEKDNYHKENMLSAGLVLINIDQMPKTHNELRDWVIEKSRDKDTLILTDVADDVKNIIAGGPVPKHIKPIWPFIAFTAFQTLPIEFKKIYGIKSSKIKNFILLINLSILKLTRPFLPPFFRLIPPARWAKQRLRNKPDLKFSDRAKI